MRPLSLAPAPAQVHWFSILNSLMVVVVMSCIVAMIMMRTIRRDLQRYEQLLVDGGKAARLRGAGCWARGRSAAPLTLQVSSPCPRPVCRHAPIS